MSRWVPLFATVMILVAIPPIIGTFYGMNVPLPGARSAWTFPFLVGLSVFIASLAAWWMRRHRWL